MKRFVLVTAIALMTINAQAGAQWYKNVADAQREAKKKNALIFVDLFAQWCGWCHKAEQDVFPSEKFQQATDDMVLLRLDTEDRGEGTQFAQSLQISSLPTFLILNRDLEIAGMIRGYAPAKEFSEEVTKQRKNYEQLEKDLAADNSKNLPKALDVAKQLLMRRAFTKAEPRFLQIIAAKNVTAPVRQEAMYNLAVTQLGLNHRDDAIKTLDKLDKMKLAPNLAEESKFTRARMYLEAQQYKSALSEFRKFKTAFPKSDKIDWVNQLIPQLESAVSKAQ